MSASEPKSPEELREEIEHTREELGDTVEALAAKTDVKAQMHAQADALRESAQQLGSRARDAIPDSAQQGVAQAGQVVKRRPVPVAAVAAFAGGVLLGWLLRRR
jgi:ElaB/YqjD/DUF883 family membrane-anchored ribosome-binding protein